MMAHFGSGKTNLTLLTDFYELTMANGYFEEGLAEEIVYFDMFFRKIPDQGGFVIAAGLEQLIEYIEHLRFTPEDISYLRGKNLFSEGFLAYLETFRFTGDIWAVPEGTVVFPGEPLVTVRGPVIEAQFIETMLLLAINHQSLIATKASRIVRAAEGRAVIEFGARRAHSYDAAVLGARAAYIGGCQGTSNAMTDREFGIPATGTMAHSWIQLFDSELEAFRAYARTYPQDCILLVDTYNTLKSGVPNAIKVFDEELAPRGCRPKAIRLDSGDMAYLSKEARKMLDAAGYEDCGILASNSLDEHTIKDLLDQGAQLDFFGVGERLITARSEPVFGGVYKLAGREKDGKVIPKIKLSENVTKINNPGFKDIFRLYDKDTHKAAADVIAFADETIDETRPYRLFHPEHVWKRKTISNFYVKRLHVKVFEGGRCIYERPDVEAVRAHCEGEVASLWDEVKRFDNPHEYYVDLSEALWETKQRLIEENTVE